MSIISIDGACRGNGRAGCISASATVVLDMHNDELICKHVSVDTEDASTNQRGELIALLNALRYVYKDQQEAMIITDSEYIFNTMTKAWLASWSSKGWITATGDPIKNLDLWHEVQKIYNEVENLVSFIHIKGHCISVGPVTADTAISEDVTGNTLLAVLQRQYNMQSITTRKDKLVQANKLSERNNGFQLEPEVLKNCVVSNAMADTIASRHLSKL